MIGDIEDWYNLNSLRSYPFEYKKYELSDKNFTFSDLLIVDCMAIVHVNDAKISLSSIHFSGNIFTATFYDSILDQDIFMAQGSLLNKFVSSPIIPLSDVGVSGNVAFGDLTKFYHMRLSGLHKFTNTNIPLINYCYICAGEPAIKSIEYNMGKVVGDIDLSTIGLLNTMVDSNNNTIRQINQNGVTQKVVIDQSNVLFYLSDPSVIEDICQPPRTVCDCPHTPIKKINNVSPNPQNGNINIEVGDFKLNEQNGKFELEVGSSSSGLEIENTADGIILSLQKNSEEICDDTKIIPFPDGRLPSEEFII